MRLYVERNHGDVAETERKRILPESDYQTQTPAHLFIDSKVKTFASLCSVVDITRWAVTTFHGSRHVNALAFAVAAAVAFKALVYV